MRTVLAAEDDLDDERPDDVNVQANLPERTGAGAVLRKTTSLSTSLGGPETLSLPVSSRMSRPSLQRFVVVALLAVLLPACAEIESFRAEPRNACVGDEVQVSWEASGRVSLLSIPVLPGTGRQSSTDSRSFTIDVPTRFELTAHRLFKDDTAEAEIDVAPPEHTFGKRATCMSEEGRLISAMELKTQLSPGFRIQSVRNVLGREMRVEKDGLAILLAAGEESDGLQGLPVLGTWEMTSPLGLGEGCDVALRSIQQRLRVKIHLSCGE